MYETLYSQPLNAVWTVFVRRNFILLSPRAPLRWARAGTPAVIPCRIPLPYASMAGDVPCLAGKSSPAQHPPVMNTGSKRAGTSFEDFSKDAPAFLRARYTRARQACRSLRKPLSGCRHNRMCGRRSSQRLLPGQCSRRTTSPSAAAAAAKKRHSLVPPHC